MSREAMQMALEALEQYKGVVVTHHDPESFRRMEVDGGQAARDAIAALRAALAEPEQPPKGWIDEMAEVPEHLWKEWSEGYTAPTPRKPLSEDEIVRLMVGESRARLMLAGKEDPEFLRFAEEAIRELVEYARAIEKAHGIGEQT